MHKSFEELKRELEEAKGKVSVGSVYSHYKSPDSRYLVTGISILEATDEIAVKYSPVNEPNIEFVRALSSWLEDVLWQDKTLPRFSLVK